jgi:hypothetical protein
MRQISWLVVVSAAVGSGTSWAQDHKPDAATSAIATAGADDVTGLVRQLADPSFQKREEAGRKLRALGMQAERSLLGGAQDRDPEVRARCQRVLQQIRRDALDARIQAFESAGDLDATVTLPGWERFRDVVGNDREARRLYADMWRAEPVLLGMAGRRDPGTEHELEARCTSFDQVADALGRYEIQISHAQLATLLFIAADTGVKFSIPPAASLMTTLARASNLSLAPKGRPGLVRRLVVHLIEGQRDPWPYPPGFSGASPVPQALLMALKLDLTELLQYALRQLKDPAASTRSRAAAAVVVARFGGRKHIPDLESALGDTGITGRLQWSIDNKHGETTTRVQDVALAMLVHLTGQKYADYKFLDGDDPRFDPLLRPESWPRVAFASETTRRVALRQWQAWKRQEESHE